MTEKVYIKQYYEILKHADNSKELIGPIDNIHEVTKVGGVPPSNPTYVQVIDDRIVAAFTNEEIGFKLVEV